VQVMVHECVDVCAELDAVQDAVSRHLVCCVTAQLLHDTMQTNAININSRSIEIKCDVKKTKI